jgi:hypothetical protein
MQKDAVTNTEFSPEVKMNETDAWVVRIAVSRCFAKSLTLKDKKNRTFFSRNVDV